MQDTRGGSLEGLSIGVMFIAVAAALLLAWFMADWWLFIPFLLVFAGFVWAGLGLLRGRGEGGKEMPYFLFWGGTLVILGGIWLINDQYPGNVPGLVAFVIIWVGAAAVVLSVKRKKG